jgi:AraC-like DNA-binding protein
MYREHAPPPALAGLVECIWTITTPRALEEPIRKRVLPDGCSDIIFDFGDGAVASPGGSGGYVVGAMSTALVVELVGRVDLIGVRFRPGGGTPVLGVPAAELSGRRVALPDIAPRLGHVAARMAACAPPRRAAVLAELVDRLRSRTGGATAPDPRVGRAVRLLDRVGVSVAGVAAEVGLSPRQLERLFAHEVGATPSQARSVNRFRAAVRLLGEERAPSLASVAHMAGYFDQAHLSRDFRRLAGVTPGEYRRERRVASVQDSETTTP